MDSDPHGKPDRNRGSEVWGARVGRRLTASKSAPGPDLSGLREIAEEASRAASKAAVLAGQASRAASLAGLTIGRLGIEPITEARQAACDLADSAKQAAGSAFAAQDRASLLAHAVRADLDTRRD